MTERVKVQRGGIVIRVVPEHVESFAKAGFVKVEEKPAPRRRTAKKETEK